jgi:hypothetical protein
MSKRRVLLADDHPNMLRMVESILESMFEVVGKVADGKSLMEAADDDSASALPRWPFFGETPSPPGFLRVVLRNGRFSCCPDNIPVCEGRFGNPQTGLHRGDKSSLPLPGVVPAGVRFFLPGKHSGSYPGGREMHSAETGFSGWRRVAHLPAASFPENRSLAQPSSRCSLAWCNRYRLPSVAAFSPVAVPCGPRQAITVRCRWLPVSPPLPQLVPTLHPWKSARCS